MVDADREWQEHALSSLSAAGRRPGSAAIAIVESLSREGCCVTVREIARALEDSRRPVGLASVYRVLEQLRELRLVHRLEMSDGVARYERAGPVDTHHDHLICERCGRVVPFADRELEHALDRVCERVDFDVDRHSVVLYGRCGGCEAGRGD